MRENPPIMVLAEESPEEVTFRFRGRRWAVATLIPGVALLWLVRYLYLLGRSQTWMLVVVGVFGLMLVYSSVYSATADQWLTVSGLRKTVRFHKKNLYGRVAWEKAPGEFRNIRVGRYTRPSNWHIALVGRDGFELYLGEHAFGAFTLERAIQVAAKVSQRTGIPLEAPNQI
ncbi:hypothetical protein [Geothrix fuzhouensis]|uniref:hypothetical protein n=1 Tax=Geothrix fuzhouensis TaxID=2966451 RepID=UPI002147D47E|nr:hypothetical protein [Geothrix fuzhouensis]